VTVASPTRPNPATPVSDRLVARLVERFGDRARPDEPLGPRCTYRVGGPARVLVTVDSPADLVVLASLLAAEPGDAEPGAAGNGPRVAVLVVGRGSNLLVADRGFDGVAVELGPAFASVEVDGTTVTAGAAAALPVVARRSAAAGLTGFEWAVGVPGSIGGAVAMNAGGHGSDLAASLVAVAVVDLHAAGAVRRVPAADLRLAYRSSALGAPEVVVSAELSLHPGDAERSRALIDEIVAWRLANQPGGHNAGSVFANPAGDSAGRLIDAAGAKGLRHGSAEVSAKHANFIQVDAGGSADDVFVLMGEVRRRVLAAGGPRLVPETRLVGFDRDLAGDGPADRPDGEPADGPEDRPDGGPDDRPDGVAR
jgi:UDP-N-acetylmuramate dehydrogenase